MNVLKLLKKISLVLLVSGFTITVANAQSKNNNRIVTKKVTTVKTNKHKANTKKIVTTKTVKVVNSRKVNKSVIVKRKLATPRPNLVRLPSKARFVMHNNVKYAYHNGLFFRPFGKSYIKVNRPTGLGISIIL